MQRYRFAVVLADGQQVERRMEAPTRSEARGWLKRKIAAEGLKWNRIISLRPKERRSQKKAA